MLSQNAKRKSVKSFCAMYYKEIKIVYTISFHFVPNFMEKR